MFVIAAVCFLTCVCVFISGGRVCTFLLVVLCVCVLFSDPVPSLDMLRQTVLKFRFIPASGLPAIMPLDV